MNRTSLRIAIVALTMTGISGCGAISDNTVFEPDFWTNKGSVNNNSAELGLAELSKGNNVQAQANFEKALRANPSDIHALYGMAVMYQNTGQPARARQLYQTILALDPPPNDELLVWAGKQTQPIVDLANVNMHLLDNGFVVPLPGQPMVGSQAPRLSAAPMAMTPSSTRLRPTYRAAQPASAMSGPPRPMFKETDLNIVARFNTLRILLDQGLMTQDEFVGRRKVNVGALLPITSRPAATGLDRPVPTVEQISSRLHAIGRALEMRALTPAQHTAERTMILDALMPMTPSSVANPVPPPKGLMEAADAVRRLEMLKAEDLITSDEYSRERAAIESSMQPVAPKVSGNVATAKSLIAAAKATNNLSGFQPGVHLASYRQKRSANRGWAALQKRFGSVLGGLEHRIERVDLGNGKGVFYRLKAGPLPSNNAAKAMCRKLKAKRQYCDPTTINFG
ncbi:MAG: tetratricopeptide repeat protein [Magnetovibrio sp.]|nr:tetratricopeptide repeat protein [Magnetovibrio sp.]